MTPEERQLLSALVDRIKASPTQDRDSDADQMIGQLVRERPDAPYLLAQTVLMQDFALRNAQAQIAQLQSQVQSGQQQQHRSGGFLSGLFGGGQSQSAPQPATSVPPVNPWARSAPPQPAPAYAPPPQAYAPPPQAYAPQQGYAPVVMQPSQTGSFLRSAATTAAGVAGGALLFQGIESLFSGHQGGSFINPTGWGGWGGGPGGGDFGPRESLTETTINNYYGDSGGAPQSADFGGDPGWDQGGVTPADYSDPALDSGFDNSGDFSGGDLGGGGGSDDI